MTAKYFSKEVLKFFALIILIWIPLTCAFPLAATKDDMVHNDNYDMIMADDHEPAASMARQNFDQFFNAAMAPNDAMSEMEMDESRTFVIRSPQPVNPKENPLREYLFFKDH